MFKNYFITTFRNFYNNKVFSTITILGLSIGIAAFLLISLYVYHEWSYDRYHEKSSRIYRVVENIRTGGEVNYQASSAPPMGPAFVRDFTEVEDFVRFYENGYSVRKGDKVFFEKNCYLTDPSVFNVFSFELFRGNSKTALINPESVVLTESVAKKYFGTDDALGQTIEMDGTLFKITGILKDVPENSHFSFDLLVSISTYKDLKLEEEMGWYTNDFNTYLLLSEDENAIERVRAKTPDFIEGNIGEMARRYKTFYDDLILQPLSSIYLAKPGQRENGVRGSRSNLYILSVSAVFILLIASFNYVNMTSARASRRLKEVGLRKVCGADRKTIIQQFLMESMVVCMLSMALGLLLANLALPVFNDLAETSLSFELINNGFAWTAIAVFALALGIFSGIYPAFIVSGFQTTQIFQRTPGTIYSSHWLRRLMVTGQFIVSFALIAGTILVFNQLNLMQRMDLGYQKEQMLIIDFHWSSQIADHLQSVKNEILDSPDVQSISTSQMVPGEGFPHRGAWIEKKNGTPPESNINTLIVDEDFISNYGIGMSAGRSFSRDFPADDSTAFIINEAASVDFGWALPDSALGKTVYHQKKKGTIIGVVKNFNYRSLHYKVEPLLMHIDPYWFTKFSIRIKSSNVSETVSAIEKKWKRVAPGLAFNYSFLDQDFDSLYKGERQLSKIIIIFSGLSIVIACLGLIGIITFSIESRVKEIGIRKVLGASLMGIVNLISKEFILLILGAFVISTPLTYLGINRWLENFATRITISPATFILAATIVFFTASLVISYLTLLAASKNPSDSLRTD